jgi:CHASE3 domain sensor protein
MEEEDDENLEKSLKRWKDSVLQCLLRAFLLVILGGIVILINVLVRWENVTKLIRWGPTDPPK